MKGKQAFSQYSIEFKDKDGNKLQSMGNQKDKEIQSIISNGTKLFEEYEEDLIMADNESIAAMKMGFGKKVGEELERRLLNISFVITSKVLMKL